MQRRILIVEDNAVTSTLLKRALKRELGLASVVAASHQDTLAVLDREGRDSFSLALVDLQLPDAAAGETLDLLVNRGFPCIVFTGDFSDEVRERMVSRKVLDYLLKENAQSVNAVVRLVGRIHQNESLKVLVVDDSPTSRRALVQLLERHRFQVLESGSGEEALAFLEAQGEVALAIVDYHMPGMDGAELTRRIREKVDLNRMAIIGVSARGNDLLSARFLKSGANDFIARPFLEEEFYCRVNLNVAMLDTIRSLRDASMRDALTGLYNRRYFQEAAAQAYASLRRGHQPFAIGMIDLDFFKRINDTHGHEAGDRVLQAVAKALAQRVRGSDILARLGGEEFCLFAANVTPDKAGAFFDQVREAIAGLEIPYLGTSLQITASIGVCTRPGNSMSSMLGVADAMLYQAKAIGRNCIVPDFAPLDLGHLDPGGAHVPIRG